MSRLFPFVLAFILLAVLAVSLVVAPAKAAPRSTEAVMHEILHDRGSPLADIAYNAVAFRRYQGPAVDLLAMYAVAWAETNLGRDGFWAKTYNLGCIRGGSSGSPWRDWRTGTYHSFNVYASPYMGQRAMIRLLWEASYMPLLKAHDWRGFTKRYWGGDYWTHASHREDYIGNLSAAYRLLVSDGRSHGLNPTHLR